MKEGDGQRRTERRPLAHTERGSRGQRIAQHVLHHGAGQSKHRTDHRSGGRPRQAHVVENHFGSPGSASQKHINRHRPFDPLNACGQGKVENANESRNKDERTQAFGKETLLTKRRKGLLACNAGSRFTGKFCCQCGILCHLKSRKGDLSVRRPQCSHTVIPTAAIKESHDFIESSSKVNVCKLLREKNRSGVVGVGQTVGDVG